MENNEDYILINIYIEKDSKKNPLCSTKDPTQAKADCDKYAEDFNQEIESGKAKIVMETLICGYPLA